MKRRMPGEALILLTVCSERLEFRGLNEVRVTIVCWQHPPHETSTTTAWRLHDRPGYPVSCGIGLADGYPFVGGYQFVDVFFLVAVALLVL